jgi:hypothetical protein
MCPIKQKCHKPLHIATQLEQNLIQKIFGLHLSYLVLSHLWYNLGIMGSTDATSPRATLCQVIGTLTPWSYANVPKHILTSSRMRA